MRNIPVDGRTVGTLAMGVTPVQVWGETDGKRVMTNDQEREEHTGLPLWSLECIVPASDPRDRTEVIAVRLAARTAPEIVPLTPIVLEGLICSVWAGKDGKLAQRWSALGIAEHQVNGSRKGTDAA